MPQRWKKLPAQGQLMVVTDIHGHGDDFRRIRELYLHYRHTNPDTHLVILGDVVHGPNPDFRPLFEGQDGYYPDESGAIVMGILDLQAAYPDEVHYVLGNHDYGHVGGPHTRKYYHDEVDQLESQLSKVERDAMQTLFRQALLGIVAPCGLFLSHGAPNDRLESLDVLNQINFPPDETYLDDVLYSFLNSYGQPGEVAANFLKMISATTGIPVHILIHGHDTDPNGYFTEYGNQLCPVIATAPRLKKRYLLLDLAAHYTHVGDIRDGYEILCLYMF